MAAVQQLGKLVCRLRPIRAWRCVADRGGWSLPFSHYAESFVHDRAKTLVCATLAAPAKEAGSAPWPNVLQNHGSWQYPRATKLGYARVSTQDQDLKAQREALEASGCERIFEEKASGGRWERPQLEKLMEQLRPGEVVVVWKLDRLSRSLKDLLFLLERIEKAEASFQSLTEAIDMGTPSGRMMMQMLGAFAEFERKMLRERTPAPALMSSAKRDGSTDAGHKLTPVQRREALAMVRSGQKTGAEVARIFRLHPSTIYHLPATGRASAGLKTGS